MARAKAFSCCMLAAVFSGGSEFWCWPALLAEVGNVVVVLAHLECGAFGGEIFEGLLVLRIGGEPEIAANLLVIVVERAPG